MLGMAAEPPTQLSWVVLGVADDRPRPHTIAQMLRPGPRQARAAPAPCDGALQYRAAWPPLDPALGEHGVDALSTLPWGPCIPTSTQPPSRARERESTTGCQTVASSGRGVAAVGPAPSTRA